MSAGVGLARNNYRPPPSPAIAATHPGTASSAGHRSVQHSDVRGVGWPHLPERLRAGRNERQWDYTGLRAEE